jgi:hypothetical protein
MQHIRWLTAIPLMLAWIPAQAVIANNDTSDYLLKRWRLTISGFQPEIDGTLRVDPNVDVNGTQIDLEQDLRLDDFDTAPQLDLTVRLTPHHRIDLDYFQLSRSESHALDRQITFGDETFDVNAEVSADLDVQLGQINYGWSFLNNGRTELGVSIGAYIARLEAELRGRVGTSTEAKERADTTVGFPVLGAHGALAITPQWVISGQAQWLQLSVDDYDVTLSQLSLELDYQIMEHIGLSAGYSYYNMDIERDDNDFSGELDLGFQGPSLGVSFYF